MSCIAGLFCRDGAPAQPRLIERMLSRMQARAPHGNQVVCKGSVGFGHALLQTDSSRKSGSYPIAGDPQVWITADARIDDRAALIRRLRTAGRQVQDNETHAGLILHAYQAYGPALVDHLIGDFAFALWDEQAGRLLCARDHFGVRPFHYVQTAKFFAFASDPDALLAVPQVSGELDDISVADFLIFGSCRDPERSIFRDVHCLPPASNTVVTKFTQAVRSYWELPREVETRFLRAEDYVDAFQQHFEEAVIDRLPDGPVALQLSGGMDSTSIAAVAASAGRHSGQRVSAYHVSCSDLFAEDDERAHTELVAAHLAIPLSCNELGRHRLYHRSNDPAFHTAFPLTYPHLAAHDEILGEIRRSGAHVLLGGHGADAVLTPSATYYSGLLRGGHLWKLGKDMLHHVRHTGSLAGMGLRSALLPGRAEPPWMPPMPDWIEPAFAARVKLNDRWHTQWECYRGNFDAYHQLRQTWISRTFSAVEILKRPVVVRYPFYDIRLVQFLLGLPNFMLSGKRVLREAMRGRLPEIIRTRPKTPLMADPQRKMVTAGKLNPDPVFSCQGVMQDRYIHALERYRAGAGADSTWNSLLILAPVAMGIWLQQQGKGFPDEESIQYPH